MVKFAIKLKKTQVFLNKPSQFYAQSLDSGFVKQ